MYHHAHPPLTDIILHFWLALTASRLWLEPTARAQAQLEGRRVLLWDEKLVRDPGYHWRRRVFPGAGQLPWRVQVRTYKCVESQ
jgi:hypothetical protein